MKDAESEHNRHRKIREDVIGGGVADQMFPCSINDINTVLKDWEKIRNNMKELGIKVSQNYFVDNPEYRKLFPSFAHVSDNELDQNEDFVTHSYAIMRGLNTIMKNFSAEYEEDNDVLPTIGFTHQKRGITNETMNDLKESILTVCCQYVHSDRKGMNSWQNVLDFIFDNYLCKVYRKDEKEFLEKCTSLNIN